MEEFIRNNRKILKIENPLTLFQSVLSLGTDPKAERWQTLNTLMAINNHRRIDHLESSLESERARVRFIEDLNEQINEKVAHLEVSMEVVKRQVKVQNRNLMTVLLLVKLISKTSRDKGSKFKFLAKLKQIGIFLAHNGILFGAVQVLMRILWIDTILDSLMELLKLANILSKKSMERSKFVIRLSISIAIFSILRKRINGGLERLGKTLSIFG